MEAGYFFCQLTGFLSHGYSVFATAIAVLFETSSRRVRKPGDYPIRPLCYLYFIAHFLSLKQCFFFFCTHTEVLVMIISDQFLCLTITALMMTYKLGLH